MAKRKKLENISKLQSLWWNIQLIFAIILALIFMYGVGGGLASIGNYIHK